MAKAKSKKPSGKKAPAKVVAPVSYDKPSTDGLSESEHGQAWERGESIACAKNETDPLSGEQE